MKKIDKKNFKSNISFVLKENNKHELKNIKDELNTKLGLINEKIIYLDILIRNAEISENKYKLEVSNLKDLGKLAIFPYKSKKNLNKIISGFDDKRQLPFVLHAENKKLYFPKLWSIQDAADAYRNFIENENILGGDYMEKSPHKYQSNKYYVRDNDVVFDIGAAEALFSLDVIDKVKKIYIFEYQEMWLEPLYATFEPYAKKVEIINKMVSDKNSPTETKLINYFNLDECKRVFVKMDIEGNEKHVLENNIDFFSQDIEINVACTTYHEHNDEEILNNIFARIGYNTEFSDGYMIFKYDENIIPPYFRKGMIRAGKYPNTTNI